MQNLSYRVQVALKEQLTGGLVIVHTRRRTRIEITATELVDLAKSIRMPVGIEINSGGESAFVKPAALNRRMRFAQNGTGRHDYIATHDSRFRIADRSNVEPELNVPNAMSHSGRSE